MTTVPDLRSFLDEIRREAPGEFLAVTDEVPLDYTSTALTLELERRGRQPVLLFNRVQGHDLRLAANLFASREVIARGVQATPETLAEVLGEKLDELLPAQAVASGPVQEVVWLGEDADLTKLPIPRHFIQDAGPYITAGMIAARDPDTGVSNLAYVRLQVTGAAAARRQPPQPPAHLGLSPPRRAEGARPGGRGGDRRASGRDAGRRGQAGDRRG